MKREFVYLQNFDGIWKSLGLSDDEQRELEDMILENPATGVLIQGAGGLRKTRYAIGVKGKSGGIRVLYVDFESYEKTYLLFAYTKSQNENITDRQKLMFKQKINTLLDELRKKGAQ